MISSDTNWADHSIFCSKFNFLSILTGETGCSTVEKLSLFHNWMQKVKLYHTKSSVHVKYFLFWIWIIMVYTVKMKHYNILVAGKILDVFLVYMWWVQNILNFLFQLLKKITISKIFELMSEFMIPVITFTARRGR